MANLALAEENRRNLAPEIHRLRRRRSVRRQGERDNKDDPAEMPKHSHSLVVYDTSPVHPNILHLSGLIVDLPNAPCAATASASRRPMRRVGDGPRFVGI